jgi:hypothetical protein
MTANELRIGNLVFYNGDPFKIEMIRDRDYDYNPIPLTVKWLKKFGFLEPKDERQQREKYPTIHTSISWVLRGNTPESDWFRVYQKIKEPGILDDEYDIRGIRFGEFRVYASQYFVKTIDYVHQLQNIYSILTEQELIYDSKKRLF